MAITTIITTATATIANAGTVSDAVSLGNATVTGIITPAALTGTALTFQVSADGSTYTALYDNTGSAVSFTVAASRALYVDPAIFVGWTHCKVVSGSAEAAQRLITLVVRPV